MQAAARRRRRCADRRRGSARLRARRRHRRLPRARPAAARRLGQRLLRRRDRVRRRSPHPGPGHPAHLDAGPAAPAARRGRRGPGARRGRVAGRPRVAACRAGSSPRPVDRSSPRAASSATSTSTRSLEVAMSARHLPAVAEVRRRARPDAVQRVRRRVERREPASPAGSSSSAATSTDWEPNVVDAMAELRAIAALDKSRSEGSRPAWFDITDETIRLVTHESDRPETATHLRQIGVDVTRPIVVVVAGLSTGDRRRGRRPLDPDRRRQPRRHSPSSG